MKRIGGSRLRAGMSLCLPAGWCLVSRPVFILALGEEV